MDRAQNIKNDDDIHRLAKLYKRISFKEKEKKEVKLKKELEPIDENNNKLKTKKVFSSKTTPGYTSSVFEYASDVDIPGNAFYAWLFLLLTLDLGVALPTMFMVFEHGGGLLILHLFLFSIWIALLFRAYSKKQ